MMLQQTQTSRVIEKFAEFIKAFPTVSRLSKADQKDVLKLWQGLGYNRRALYLLQTARTICEKHNGRVPSLKEKLVTLPGVGNNTAGAVIAFAHNFPAIFIETNIRRVFIHEFFREKEKVSDQEIFPLIEATLDQKNPREWYYALMDYGAYLSKFETNPNRKSMHYKKQSKFDGSMRQVRGKILKLLLEKPHSMQEFEKLFDEKEYLIKALYQLEKEGFILCSGKNVFLAHQ